ncbi:MAG: rod-binding protein [Planctomycetota bacterium]|nr:rod-binding protein [Planctomycetota bacterium]
MTNTLSMPSVSTLPFAAAENAMVTGKMSELASRLDKPQENDEQREQFQNILGELLFGQMLKSMRKTVGEAAYFHGGRAEEIFTEQLDQHIARGMSKTMSEQFVGPMYELTMMGRK